MNKIKQHKKLFVAGLLIALFFVGGAIVKAEDGKTTLDRIIERAAQLIAKDVIEDSSGGVLGGTEKLQDTGKATVTNWTEYKDTDTDTAKRRRVVMGTIGTASSTIRAFENIYNQPLYISNFLFQPIGNASTTVEFEVGTSTIAYSTDWNDCGTANGLIDTLVMATGTAPLINSVNDGGTLGKNVIKVDEGDFLLFCMKAPASNWAVTSTGDRGFSADSWYSFDMEMHATSTNLW